MKKNFLIITALVLFMCSPSAYSKEMTQRLGIGYADQLSVNTPSISAKYYATPTMAYSLDLGLQTGDDDSAFGLLAKVYKTIFPEDNLNFYMGGGAGLISQKINSGDNDSGFDLMAFVGVEFFLPGIDSVGFNFEAGIGIQSISSDTEFRTVGHSPIKAGMYFYF